MSEIIFKKELICNKDKIGFYGFRYLFFNNKLENDLFNYDNMTVFFEKLLNFKWWKPYARFKDNYKISLVVEKIEGITK